MKFRLLLSLLAIFLIAKGLGWCAEPTKIVCNVMQPVERPNVWDVYIVTEQSQSEHVNRWISEHQSRKSALKACDKLIAEQEKRWKQAGKKK